MSDRLAGSDPLKSGSSSGESPARDGIRLSKDQRKELLAEIERQLSRSETPQRLAQRVEQALSDGNLDQARRLVQHLESVSPQMAALPVLKQKLEQIEGAEKRKANLAKAEEMLLRYIQQRKKALAVMGLETFLELAPNHPRRQEYERWVADLDKELELQEQLDAELAAGRAALLADDLAKARRHVRMLKKLDPTAGAAETLVREVADAELEQAENADIERLKSRVEELISGEQLADAELEIERLAKLDVPKLTVDFLRQRLEQVRLAARDRSESETLIALVQRQLDAKDWQGARESAHRYGERFPHRPEGPQLFNRVTEMEAAERRKQSLSQGIETLEKFIGEGKKPEAEVAIKLLRRLELNAEQLAVYEARVAQM